VGGAIYKKGTILYRVWRNDRWFVGNKKFGVVSHLIVGGGGGAGGILPQKMLVFFYPYDCNSLHFLRQIFGYTALHYAVDRLNLQLSTCIVGLCRYHNLAVTQGASGGARLARSATMVGTERINFASLNRRKWCFQSLLYVFC
jgi:hypothetical protein